LSDLLYPQYHDSKPDDDVIQTKNQVDLNFRPPILFFLYLIFHIVGNYITLRNVNPFTQDILIYKVTFAILHGFVIVQTLALAGVLLLNYSSWIFLQKVNPVIFSVALINFVIFIDIARNYGLSIYIMHDFYYNIIFLTVLSMFVCTSFNDFRNFIFVKTENHRYLIVEELEEMRKQSKMEYLDHLKLTPNHQQFPLMFNLSLFISIYVMSTMFMILIEWLTINPIVFFTDFGDNLTLILMVYLYLISIILIELYYLSGKRFELLIVYFGLQVLSITFAFILTLILLPINFGLNLLLLVWITSVVAGLYFLIFKKPFIKLSYHKGLFNFSYLKDPMINILEDLKTLKEENLLK
jgi:hypothetical protein